MNSFHGIGRLTSDPEVKYSQGENPTCIASYTIAIDRMFKNKDGGKETDFIRCKAFGKSGEFAEKYFKKGMKVAISGRIQTGSYTNRDGNKVYTTDIVVENQEFCESKNSQNQQTTQPATPPPGQYQPQPQTQQYQAPPQPVQQPQYQQAPPTQYRPQSQPQQQYQQYQQQPQQPVFQQADPDWMKIPDGAGDTLPFT